MANLADLAIGLGLDPSDLTSGMSEAEDAVDGFEDSTSSMASFVEDNFAKIGGAALGVGAGLEGFARGQQDSNMAFERLARMTGESSGSWRTMATDISNVTFPLEDATALMETAAKRGLEGDAIGEYATFWDMVGDATGEAGPALGEAGTALGLVGIAAGDEAEALDAFGFITDNTTGSVEGFLGFVERTASELGDATPSIDDMAGALAALEDKGYSQQRAQREMRTALSETDGDMVAALETLGVSEEAYREQAAAVEGSGAAIEGNAAILADSFTPMQKAAHWAEELMTKYGGLGDVAGMVAAPLSGVGSVMLGVGTMFPGFVSGIGSVASKMGGMVGTAASWAASTATSAGRFAMSMATSTASAIASGASWVASTVAQGATALASMATTTGQFIAHYAKMAAQSLIQAGRMAVSWVIAMGPVGWVIAGVVALAALIAANWDKVVEWTRKAWSWVSEKVAAAWEAVTGFVRKGAEKVGGFVRRMRDKVTGFVGRLRDKVVGFFTGLRDKVVGAARGMRDKVVEWVTRLRDGAVNIIRKLRDRYVAIVTGIRDKIVGLFRAIRDKAVEWARRLRDGAVNIIRSMRDGYIKMGRAIRDKVVGFFRSLRTKAVEWVRRFRDAAVDRFVSLVAFVRNIPDRILSALGNLGRLLYDAGRNVISGLLDGITSKFSAIGDTMSSAADKVRNMWPFSPAKEGPLSGRGAMKFAGENLMTDLAAGIDRKSSVVADASGRVAGAIAMPGMAAGTFRTRGHDGATMDPDVLAEALTRALDRSRIRAVVATDDQDVYERSRRGQSSLVGRRGASQ